MQMHCSAGHRYFIFCKILTTIAAAFAKGLCKDDYPAWAQGIVYRAAVKLTDETVASGLKEPLLKAIQEARLAERTAEAMLGELTAAGFEISVPKQVVKPQ